MSECRYPLNPNANTFIPNKHSEALREMAVKAVAELFEKKKAKGETTVTNQEIAKLVGHFISIGFKKLTDSNKLKIHNFLNKKLQHFKIPALRPVSDLLKIKSNLSMNPPKSYKLKESFDASKWYAPTTGTFLLVAFWGLYRHEQAQRPLLSLTYRPDVVKDKIWSVDASDKKLWNQSCVSEVCDCPPMFGYCVPPNFFGDFSHLHYTCSVQKIHLNHYPESTEGNEFILTANHRCLLDESPLEDIVVNINIKANLYDLKDQFESTVTGICNVLSKFAEAPETKTEDVMDDVNDYYASLWDDDPRNISYVPFSEQSRDSLVDNNDHPLLEMPEICMDEEVPLEVKEMIRRSLSPKENKENSNDIKGINEDKNKVCDPPCSVWCGSLNKKTKFEEVFSVHSESAQDNDTIKDAPTVDLVSFDEQDSKEKVEPVNIILNPIPNLCGSKTKKNQRSLSDGCDPFDYEAKFDISRIPAHAFNSTSKDRFALLTEYVNFFESNNGGDSWEDTDSGFMSLSSSQDDVFCDKYEHEAKGSTWKFVTGEDSLWSPLPECVETNKLHFPHKQIRNFRRQRSGS